MLDCLVGFWMIITGGEHFADASLVELTSGNVVLLDILRGSRGDVGDKACAKEMVDAYWPRCRRRRVPCPICRARLI